MGVACIAISSACSKQPTGVIEKASLATVKPGTTLSADPNPIVTADGSGVGETTILWSTTVPQVEIRIGAPNGKIFARGGVTGKAPTGFWVGNGMTFYLQDSTAPDPTAATATLGSLAVTVK